jgi:hypothetical protein
MKPPIGMEHRPGLRMEIPAIATGLTWMAVHGNLCLALRHPANSGPSRKLIENFVRQLGENLVENGVLTAAELAEVQRTEQLPR